MSESITKSASSSKGRGRSNGVAALVEEARAATRKGHLEIRVWLRLLGCSVKMESLLSQRLRKEFKTSLSRFDVLAQLERFPDGLTMSDLSRLIPLSARVVLDVGCGDGMLGQAYRRLNPNARLLAIDSDPAMVAAARERYDEANRVRP